MKETKQSSDFVTGVTKQLTGMTNTPEGDKVTVSGILANIIHAGIGFAATFFPMKFIVKKPMGFKLK